MSLSAPDLSIIVQSGIPNNNVRLGLPVDDSNHDISIEHRLFESFI